jgi:hypothetical protein
MSTETATPATHSHTAPHASATGHTATRNGSSTRKTSKRRTAPRAVRHTSNNRLAALSHGDIATATQGISQQLMEMKEKGAQTAETIEKGIVKNPKSSVLLAFGVGYVLARLGRWL